MEKTGLSFSSGGGLTASDLNTMNDKINEIVDFLNLYLSPEFVISGNSMSLESAIQEVPADMRKEGLRLRFKDSGVWFEYLWLGGEYEDLSTWKTTEGNVIDGGEW